MILSDAAGVSILQQFFVVPMDGGCGFLCGHTVGRSRNTAHTSSAATEEEGGIPTLPGAFRLTAPAGAFWGWKMGHHILKNGVAV